MVTLGAFAVLAKPLGITQYQLVRAGGTFPNVVVDTFDSLFHLHCLAKQLIILFLIIDTQHFALAFGANPAMVSSPVAISNDRD
jgi:hypothetical protein